RVPGNFVMGIANSVLPDRWLRACFGVALSSLRRLREQEDRRSGDFYFGSPALWEPLQLWMTSLFRPAPRRSDRRRVLLGVALGLLRRLPEQEDRRSGDSFSARL